LCSWPTTSATFRSDVLSAFGPVGGATAGPDGNVDLGAVGTTGVVLTGVGTGATGGGGATTGVFGGSTAAVLGLASGTGALHTLDPKAGTAAGGEEGRGAYLSLEASARLASRASSLPGSLRSFAEAGSTATEERRE
jgi:hypothetical protein